MTMLSEEVKTGKRLTIHLANVMLEGHLEIPEGAKGVVLFAHGSGSGRRSPRNNFVAGVLRQAGIGTFLFDLLTEEEDRDYSARFDIELLKKRLIGTTRWLMAELKPDRFSIGYFGASTGAAAALEAAVTLPGEVKTIVSRGGRPDMALKVLSSITAPVLLIVGGEDSQVIQLNRIAFDQLAGIKELVIIPGATHLFEEPGALEKVSVLAAGWFKKYLASSGPSTV